MYRLLSVPSHTIMHTECREQLPTLPAADRADYLRLAAASPRRRHPKILHAPGDEFNRVINVMLHDSYMQPHHHPGPEKIEHIHLLEGKVAVIVFDERGAIIRIAPLVREGGDSIAVPAYTWHTYVVLTDHAITYETMMGRYAPSSWKGFAGWAPVENVPESAPHLASLKDAVAARD